MDTGLTENTSYKYKVRARDSHGFGNYSSELSLTTLMGNIGSITSRSTSTNANIQVNGINLM